MRTALLALGGLAGAAAQQASKAEDGPQVLVHWCDATGECEAEDAALTLDASWRVQHNATPGGWQSCILQGGMWQSKLCPDPLTCAGNCAVNGMSLDDYESVHGIKELEDGVRMNYVTATEYGLNVGARMYMLDEYYHDYKVFKLKNREFAFDIDVSTIPCGVNAAVYLVAMDPTGHRKAGNNAAGAKYGTGYCDARCPHGNNFVLGEANMDWSWGACCTEMDLFEGNSKATALTVHPCTTPDFHKCKSPKDCGETKKGYHYEGHCDKDGCDFNSYRMGDTKFWGEEGAVTTSDIITVITQFHTDDGSDDGELSEIRRVYMQGGKVIQNSKSTLEGIEGDSITNEYCDANKAAFGATRAKGKGGDFNQFSKKGGLAKVSKALEQGMVVAISLWDDPGSNMRWLDSVSPHKKPNVKGAKRGPCDPDMSMMHTRRMHQRAYVEVTNFIYGEIGATVKAKSAPAKDRLRRYTDRKVRASRHVPAAARRPLISLALAGVASAALLAMAGLGWSRLRTRRALRDYRSSAQEEGAALEAASPLAPAVDDGAESS